MKTAHKALLVFCFLSLVAMLIGTTRASLEQNLFTQWSEIVTGPWFEVTLLDFYINQFILYFWVLALETKTWVRILWLVLFICLGSIGTACFIIYRLSSNRPLLQKEKRL